MKQQTKLSFSSVPNNWVNPVLNYKPEGDNNLHATPHNSNFTLQDHKAPPSTFMPVYARPLFSVPLPGSSSCKHGDELSEFHKM